jgi:hypothetical protein
MLLARTTPIEECRKPTESMTLFLTPLDRAFVEVREIRKMGRAGSTRIPSSSTTFRCRRRPDRRRRQRVSHPTQVVLR